MSIDIDKLVADIQAGDRRALARAITLVESSRSEHRHLALIVLERLGPTAGGALRVGVSGAPGAGKSTFIETLGNHLIDQGRRVAVLTIDPSSALSGGSILGDKTRMHRLAVRPEAFIRPSPAGSTLGGVNRYTREAIVLCEAAQFDIVLVETVGVGQSETTVADLTDLLVLLLLPAAGDELQGIKRGIVELADLVLVNKADGNLLAAAIQTATDYRQALHLLHARTRDWTVPVHTCSALSATGMAEIWDTVVAYQQVVENNGVLKQRRAEQARSWLWSEMAATMLSRFREHERTRQRLAAIEQDVMAGDMVATVAAQRLVEGYFVDQLRAAREMAGAP
ncbi:MAG: methylmalonyl Co-A mutase-associated GTPase MeaB [Gammaproteobacteria bacterium]|nr:methylmalonyl Co-A mutase-associated GTPase MeaB [Gammaproteobacteria bacterium]